MVCEPGRERSNIKGLQVKLSLPVKKDQIKVTLEFNEREESGFDVVFYTVRLY